VERARKPRVCNRDDDAECDRAKKQDAASRRRFRLYWLLIRPFSGLMRRLMLRAIAREATHP